MIFVENLLNGVATGLGYLLLCGVFALFMWKLGPKLYGKFLNQMLQGMTARPATAQDTDTVWCINCRGPSYKRYPYCPWCGVKRQLELEDCPTCGGCGWFWAEDPRDDGKPRATTPCPNCKDGKVPKEGKNAHCNREC